MEGGNTIKEKLLKLRQDKLKSLVRNFIFLSIVLTVIGVAFISMQMKNVFLFCVGALIPTFSSIILDRKPGRFSTKILSSFNLTGICPYLIAIFSSGSPDASAIDIIYNPTSWVVIYGFSAVGWGIIYVIPQITLVFLEIKSRYMVKKIDSFQQELINEWGEEVAK
ncbi:MAG TPA: hypothetical protein DIV86_03945 [Alphaproteobacteria bacterium]|nr:hypothetical protein [Alphaproteobacteria bacterium]